MHRALQADAVHGDVLEPEQVGPGVQPGELVPAERVGAQRANAADGAWRGHGRQLHDGTDQGTHGKRVEDNASDARAVTVRRLPLTVCVGTADGGGERGAEDAPVSPDAIRITEPRRGTP